MNHFKAFFKSETVLVLSALAAVITMFFITPSSAYVNYIDFRVLALLFCLMAVVKGFQRVGVFAVLSQKFVGSTANTRGLSLVLVLLCFFSSMLITNDVALITFVPFTILVLQLTGQEKYMIPVIVLQTIAANLGSMLTPIGNPQNLYLYTYYHLGTAEFFKTTLPVTAVSLLLIGTSVFFIHGENISVQFKEKLNISSPKALIGYMGLFVLCLATVFHLLDYRVTLGIVILALLIFDRALFKEIDYGLLATFVCFFIFVGNIGSIDAARNLLTQLISGHEKLSAIVLSQVISNVPAAVLPSTFTDNSRALLLGTNIGGLGTLIASLASLISFKQYVKAENARPLRYLLVFTGINAVFLAVLCLFSWAFL